MQRWAVSRILYLALSSRVGDSHLSGSYIAVTLKPPTMYPVKSPKGDYGASLELHQVGFALPMCYHTGT